MRYQDTYPEPPLLDSASLVRASAAELLTLEYFEAEPGEMPAEVYTQHHILLNLRPGPQRVENVRDGVHRDFILQQDEVVVTPAGVRSGWRWYERSKVIVITLEPDKLERFARTEVGVVLTATQLRDQPQFTDADLCRAGEMVKDALQTRQLGSDVMFESLARIFLVKLIERYGDRHDVEAEGTGLSTQQYKRVLDFVATGYARSIGVEDLARQAGLSASHFSRLFKQTLGESPHRFVMSYRVEQARKKLADPDVALIDVAHDCGFADQAHFSRTFKQLAGVTPKAYRSSTQQE
ncbi:MAG: helix-turn-helix transcriptional regulator [Acidobacteriota bacterium]